MGADRVTLAVLVNAYREETVAGEAEGRTVLGLHPALAPIKAGVFPLVKKDGMPEFATRLAAELRRAFPVFYDESGSIGRRYRRQDEVGTPFCITVDGQTAADETVTVRERDTLEQDRVAATALAGYIAERMPRRDGPVGTWRGAQRLTLDRLRADGQTLHGRGLARVLWSHSGLKATAELQPIYERHARVTGIGGASIWCAPSFGIRARHEAHRSAPADAGMGGRVSGGPSAGRDRGARDRLGVLGRRPAAGRTGRAVPASGDRDRQRAGSARAAGTRRGSGGARRERELVPIRRERLQRERDFVEGWSSRANYNAAFEALSGIALPALVDRMPRRAWRTREAMWDDLLPARRAAVARGPGRRTDACRRARAVPRAGVRSVSSRARQWRRRCARQVAEMGIDADAQAADPLRYGRASREAVAGVLRAGAGPRRGVSRHAAARRPDGLPDAAARARPRAALRAHRAPTIHSSIAGSATTR